MIVHQQNEPSGDSPGEHGQTRTEYAAQKAEDDGQLTISLAEDALVQLELTDAAEGLEPSRIANLTQSEECEITLEEHTGSFSAKCKL